MASARAVLGSVTAALACALVSCQRYPSPSSNDPPPPVAAIAIRPVSPVVDEGSGIVLARVSGLRLAFVADEDEEAILTFDLDARQILARTPIAGRPTKLLVSKGGLLVVRREASAISMLALDDPRRPLRTAYELRTADEPTAIARAPGHESVVWVSSGSGRSIESFDLESRSKTCTIPLLRETRALAIDEGAKRAVVGYLAESGVGRVDLKTQQSDLVAIEVPPSIHTCSKHSKGCPPSIPARFARQTFGFARLATNKGEVAIVAPYTMVTSGKPETSTGGYGSSMGAAPNAFDVAMVPFSGGAKFSAPRLDRSCALPRAVAVDPKTSRIYVACMGSHAVVELESAHPDADLLEDSGGRVRVRLPVDGAPSALAIDGDKRELWVLRAGDRKLERLRLDEGSFAAASLPSALTNPTEITLPHVEGLGLSSELALGRALFHRADDRRISADGRACASCHPDGRDDGVTWPTPEGPRQTMFLAGRIARTTPYGWSAAHGALALHIRTTTHNLGGEGLDDASIAALSAYLVAMKAPPHAAKPTSDAELRGHGIFVQTGCATCHGDGRAHDIATALAGDKKHAFVAPSLHLIRESAPYFHDGRYPTLAALLRGSSSMAPTQKLSGEDLGALEAYLRTL